ncbi:MAG: hypothetical protein RID53_26795 [Coleofasciculus sp. B1-GNL1-01]
MVQHYNPQIHHRRSIRLKSYSISQSSEVQAQTDATQPTQTKF